MVSRMNAVSAAAPMTTDHVSHPPQASADDGTELSLDELDIVCGGLARAWVGAPNAATVGPAATISPHVDPVGP